MKLRTMEDVIRRGLGLSPSPRGDVAELASGSRRCIGGDAGGQKRDL